MKVNGGVYLIADISLGETELFEKLTAALENGVSIVQIYHTSADSDCLQKIDRLCELCHQKEVAVLVSNHWQILPQTQLDGIHFDQAPTNMVEIEKNAGRKLIKGLTIGNDLSAVSWAEKNNFDYLSFCSMFPSSSAGECEIVSFETVHKARTMTDLPLFVAGGINLQNINKLNTLPINGVAVISGIMAADEAGKNTSKFKAELNKINQK